MGRIKSDSVTAEEKKRRKRELERKRYQKIKSDPILYAQYQQKNKIKYQKRKEQNKVISIKDMTPRAKRAQRKKWREAFNAYYKRKKDAKAAALRFIESNSPPDSESEETSGQQRPDKIEVELRHDSVSISDILKENINPNQIITRSLKSSLSSYRSLSQNSEISLVSSRGNPDYKLIRKLRYKKDKEITALRRQLEEVKKVNDVYRKKLKRLTKKKENNMTIMNDSLLQSYTALRTHKAKQEFSRSLQDDIKSTLKNKGSLGKLIYVFRRRISKQKGLKVNKIREDIKNFLEEDENSSVAPGKKEKVKKAGVIKQKRYLTNSLYHLHRKFLTTVNYHLSFSTFSRFRPFWIFFASQKPKEICLCVIHENFELLVEALHKNHIIPHKNSTDVLIDICCDAFNPQCLLRICNDCKKKYIVNFQEFDNSLEFFYWSWVSKQEQIIQNGREKVIKIVKKEKVTIPPKEAINTFEKLLDNFSKHCGRVIAQHHAIKTLKNQLEYEEAIIHIDFSENYKCQYSKEIQAVHFGGSRKQVTLHTSVLYFFNSDHTKTTQCFATISQNLRHDAAAVWAHVVPILEYLNKKAPQITTLHFVSDSAVSQYRNYKTFFIMTAMKWMYPSLTSLTWNYTETGHGKCAPDGVGGTLKRTADAIVSRGHDIPDFDTFVEKIKNNTKNIVIETVSDYDVMEKDMLLPSNLHPFKGTQQVHQAIWNYSNKYQIIMRNLSCVEKSCINQPSCSHVKYLGSHVFRSDTSYLSNENYNIENSDHSNCKITDNIPIKTVPFTSSDEVNSVAPLKRSYAFYALNETDIPQELRLGTELAQTNPMIESDMRSECTDISLSEEIIIQNLNLMDSFHLLQADKTIDVTKDTKVPNDQLATTSALCVSPIQSSSADLTSPVISSVSYSESPDTRITVKNDFKPTKMKPKTKRQSESESEENDENLEYDEDNVHEGDWVVVNIISQKNILHRYVGQVVNESLASLDIKFAKKINDKKFKWPEKTDISVIGKYQIVKKLPPPFFKSSSKRIGAFEFPKSLRQFKINK